MSIKLLVLKSGEDIISDVAEMASGEGEDKRVVGYFLHKPCVVKIRDSQLVEKSEDENKTSFKVSLFPWMPLTTEQTIPIPADWLVTMVEPRENLKEMYIEEVLAYGKDNQSDSADNRSDSDQSD